MSWLPREFDRALQQWSDRVLYGCAAFGPRNVRLEDRISPERQREYLDVVAAVHDRDDWLVKHREYDLLNVAATRSTPRRLYQKRKLGDIPSPFRGVAPLGLAPEVRLVHVASQYALTRSIPGGRAEDLVDAFDEHDDDYLQIVLEAWWRTGGRTVFAALYDDVVDLVQSARGGDTQWASQARDCLGLSQYDPFAGPIGVVLLTYHVRDIPRVEGLRERRPVVAPTAIDSGLHDAFCPLPSAPAEGRCVDLAARGERPIREVIHPRPLLAPANIVALGQITSRAGELPLARWMHLEWIRENLGVAGFAMTTDADLAS